MLWVMPLNFSILLCFVWGIALWIQFAINNYQAFLLISSQFSMYLKNILNYQFILWKRTKSNCRLNTSRTNEIQATESFNFQLWKIWTSIQSMHEIWCAWFDLTCIDITFIHSRYLHNIYHVKNWNCMTIFFAIKQFFTNQNKLTWFWLEDWGFVYINGVLRHKHNKHARGINTSSSASIQNCTWWSNMYGPISSAG